MATPTNLELIWQGRLHVGDEPGVFGDAHYCGLACELPLTLRRFEEAGGAPPTLALTVEHVSVFAPYPGHAVTVVMFVEDPQQPYHWTERALADVRLTAGGALAVPVAVPADSPPAVRLSVRVRADTTVPPGLYGDFVLTSLALASGPHGYYASFGFDTD